MTLQIIPDEFAAALAWIERIRRHPGFAEFLKEEEAERRDGRKKLAKELTTLEGQKTKKLEALRADVDAARQAMQAARAEFSRAVEAHGRAHQTLSSESWRLTQITNEIRDALAKQSPKREKLIQAKDNLQRLYNEPVRQPTNDEIAPIRLDLFPWAQPADTDFVGATKEREQAIEDAQKEIADIEAAIEKGE